MHVEGYRLPRLLTVPWQRKVHWMMPSAWSAVWKHAVLKARNEVRVATNIETENTSELCTATAHHAAVVVLVAHPVKRRDAEATALRDRVSALSSELAQASDEASRLRLAVSRLESTASTEGKSAAGQAAALRQELATESRDKAAALQVSHLGALT